MSLPPPSPYNYNVSSTSQTETCPVPLDRYLSHLSLHIYDILPSTSHTKGPPLSPWQVSIPPSSYPAHNICEVIDPRLYILLHFESLIIGTFAFLKLLGLTESQNVGINYHCQNIY